MLSSIVDISARRRAVKRFRVAVESSPNGMVMVDADGRIVLVNREVERILRFSRRQEVTREPMDLAQALTEASRLLRATLPAGIEMRLHVAEPRPRVLADATSVQQVVMNLATNAAHAMPDGGMLEITLEAFYARDSFTRVHPTVREGSYARLAVRDSGQGMPPETLAQVFEPFFTTREPAPARGWDCRSCRAS